MLDFMKVGAKYPKRDICVIHPIFIVKKSKNLMIRGSKFYAIWDEEKKMWSTDQDDAVDLIDAELDQYAREHEAENSRCDVNISYMWNAGTGTIDAWKKYCEKQMYDNYKELDQTLVFSNMETTKEMYASKKLPYPLAEGTYDNWDKLIGTLYDEDERHKIEWAIGAIVTGESKYIQKFMVLYGDPGSGKGSILNVIEKLFEGYTAVFDAKAIGNSSNQFALESFRSNPLVAIQGDGDLSKIDSNERLNSLISHEMLSVNEKFKSSYGMKFNAFLFIGTNKPVKITDAKSGLIRRLIDVKPSGRKLPKDEYIETCNAINFELGAIAWHCKEVFEANPKAYDDYVPTGMLSITNDFYNFVEESYFVFSKDDCTTLSAAWKMYKEYVDDANVPYPLTKRVFKEELKSYFNEYYERWYTQDGARVRNYYKGFNFEKFDKQTEVIKVAEQKPIEQNTWLDFKEQSSIFDRDYAECKAQYANAMELPKQAWDKVKTQLKDLDTTKLHYVLPPSSIHIIVDFDKKDKTGKKNLQLNIEAASKFPRTYAELSKSGCGIHLHYIYNGDPELLARLYDEDVEIKVYKGGASIRRKLVKCNDLPISTISSGLPLKGEKKMNKVNSFEDERHLRACISKALRKEVHPNTKSNIDYIKYILDQAYESGMPYDVSDMEQGIFEFAANCTNHPDYCIKLIDDMHFVSKDIECLNIRLLEEDKPIVMFDIEVYPNLFMTKYKELGPDKKIVTLINPKPMDVEHFVYNHRIVGFNNLNYDNHILWAAMLGYTVEELYELSNNIINSSKQDKNKYLFSQAKAISYTDIYDVFSAGNKMSLKKWEIKLGIDHVEMDIPWDKPVPKELWGKVSQYCDNDVLATEAVWNCKKFKNDWIARQILADLAGLTVNDSTNTLTKAIIFGNNKSPQNEFNYRNLAEPVKREDIDDETMAFLQKYKPEMVAEPHGEAKSVLPYFEGYEFDQYKKESYYRGETIGEGGYVYSEPGGHGMVALLDVESMHPNSTIDEVLFGVRYTQAYLDIVFGRADIKHKAWDKVNTILGGKLTKWIEQVKNGELEAKDLANALKTAINSVYGLTSAKFPNQFKDERNIDNIVAKRGELFMIDLKHAVQERGFTVAHIKTDSIKVPDATPEIIEFIMNFGLRYGYKFVHEATYEKMILVNKAVYIAKYASPEKCMELYGYVPGDNADHWEPDKETGKVNYANIWTATGDQFAVPYVYKTLFTNEELEFDDFCRTFEVKKGALHLDFNETLENPEPYEKELKNLRDKYKKGKIGDTTMEEAERRLGPLIEAGHDYHFIGRVGRFVPVKPGCNGGNLYRIQDGKAFNATGASGYRWMESALLKGSDDAYQMIDQEFFMTLANDAIHDLDCADGINADNEPLITNRGYHWLVDPSPYLLPIYDHYEGPDDPSPENHWCFHFPIDEELPFD